MTESDARYAVELLGALANLPDVRIGLALKKSALKLELGAFEGDYDGGTGHGNALLPLAIATRIVDFAEKLIRDELARIDVVPEDR